MSPYPKVVTDTISMWHFRDLNWRYLPYMRPMKGISPPNTALCGTVPPFSDPEIPIDQIPVPFHCLSLDPKTAAPP